MYSSENLGPEDVKLASVSTVLLTLHGADGFIHNVD